MCLSFLCDPCGLCVSSSERECDLEMESKSTLTELVVHLLSRMREVRQSLGGDTDLADDPDLRFADAFDSMAMVEFLLVLGEDCGVPPGRIEQCVRQHFTTVGELAAAMQAARLTPGIPTKPETVAANPTAISPRCWLAATAVQLPDAIQSAAYLNEQLGRPPGWFESHAGIQQRRVWAGQDPLTAAVQAGRTCLDRASMSSNDVDALLVTSEAPPLLAGLAAALHHRLDLPADAVALEIGGACTGFVTALWLLREMQMTSGAALVIAVEAPSRYLTVQPGPEGETAALFGDGAAAALLCRESRGEHALPVNEVLLGCDGSSGDLIHVRRFESGSVAVHLQGQELSVRAIKTMANAVNNLVEKHGLNVNDLAAAMIHGGNGRFPDLLARQLGLPPERVHSQTAVTGNLGSASLPAAWAALPSIPTGPVIWTAVGAGLTWGAVLLNAGSV